MSVEQGLQMNSQVKPELSWLLQEGEMDWEVNWWKSYWLGKWAIRICFPGHKPICNMVCISPEEIINRLLGVPLYLSGFGGCRELFGERLDGTQWGQVDRVQLWPYHVWGQNLQLITTACPAMCWRNNVLKEDHGKYLHNNMFLS